MKNWLSYFVFGLFLVSFNSTAVEVSYSTFRLADDLYGVYANINLDLKQEKTATASLDIDNSFECGGILNGLNERNPFFIKKYLVENIEEIDLNYNSSPIWIIKSDNSKCIEQSVLNINVTVKEYNLDLNITSSFKPMKIDDIKVTDLKVKNLKYPVSLNSYKVKQQLSGYVYWGEADNFSNYGRFYFKFVWDNLAGENPLESISDYRLECLNNKGKLVTNHDYLMKPSLVKLPSLENQTIQLFPLVFSQGGEDEYFVKCDVKVVYEHRGISYQMLGVWLNN